MTTSDLLSHLYVFLLATFLGFELIRRVDLHFKSDRLLWRTF
jgi:hypothetical protein